MRGHWSRIASKKPVDLVVGLVRFLLSVAGVQAPAGLRPITDSMDDSIYRLRNHDILLLAVIALLGLGVIMVQSASSGVNSTKVKDGQPVENPLAFHMTDLGRKQLQFAGIGLVCFMAIRRIDYRRLVVKPSATWRSPALWLVGFAALLCVAVLVPGIGKEMNGARRWLVIGGGVQLQPSELAKWAAVVFLAWWLTYRPINLDKFGGFLLTLIPIGMLCLLVVIQDFGTAALIALVSLAMLLVGRVKLWHLMVVIPPALGTAYWFVAHKEYRWRRMIAFLDPYAAPQGEGYHMIQSLLSFATGGLCGTGIGGGIQKLGYLPEDTTDFIFAVICEELGLFGAILTIALYLGILYVAWQSIRAQIENRKSEIANPFAILLTFGIAAMIALQALINIAVATVSVPPKGMSLPLVSAGGSGLVITSAALGLLYSICRSKAQGLPCVEVEDPPIGKPALAM
jgi:cell division protein FtsW